MSSSHQIVAILAGGKATRFNGQDKGEILINEQRLIDIIHARLKPQSDDIIVSGTRDYGLGFPVVPDALMMDDTQPMAGGGWKICPKLSKISAPQRQFR